jgi:hypothetical protein
MSFSRREPILGHGCRLAGVGALRGDRARQRQRLARICSHEKGETKLKLKRKLVEEFSYSSTNEIFPRLSNTTTSSEVAEVVHPVFKSEDQVGSPTLFLSYRMSHSLIVPRYEARRPHRLCIILFWGRSSRSPTSIFGTQALFSFPHTVEPRCW